MMIQDVKVENWNNNNFNKHFFLSGLNECVDFSLSSQWIHIYSVEIGKTLIKLIAVMKQDIKVENCHWYKFNKRFFLSELIECVDFSLSVQWIHIYSVEIGKNAY